MLPRPAHATRGNQAQNFASPGGPARACLPICAPSNRDGIRPRPVRLLSPRGTGPLMPTSAWAHNWQIHVTPESSRSHT
jgi:hypothetical protein